MKTRSKKNLQHQSTFCDRHKERTIQRNQRYSKFEFITSLSKIFQVANQTYDHLAKTQKTRLLQILGRLESINVTQINEMIVDDIYRKHGQLLEYAKIIYMNLINSLAFLANPKIEFKESKKKCESDNFITL